MYVVELRFANATQTSTFATRYVAYEYASSLLEMFEGEEMWFDAESKTYFVTVPKKGII